MGQSGSFAHIGMTRFQGLWNASTNAGTGSAVSGGAAAGPYSNLFSDSGYAAGVTSHHDGSPQTPQNGDYWQVHTAGTTTINSISSWDVNDWIIYSGSTWIKMDIEDTVASLVTGFTTPLLSVASNGNVGIGTTSADNPFELLSSTSPQFRITHTDNVDYATLGVDSDGQLDITTVGAGVNISHICLLPEGNVGVGTSTPASALDVKGDGSAGDELLRLVLDGDRDWVFGQEGSGAGTGLRLRSLANKDFHLDASAHIFRNASGGNETLRIDPINGKVGINTTSPDAAMDIKGDGTSGYEVLRFSLDGDRDWSFAQEGSGAGTGLRLRSLAAKDFHLDASAHVFRNSSGGGETLRVDTATGRVGIGASSPASTLHVAGATAATGTTAGAPAFTFVGDTDTGMYSGGANAIKFSAGGSLAATIDSSRNVTLAQALSVGTNLSVSGDATITGDLTVSGTTTTLNTTNTTIQDKLIELATGATTGADSGIVIERGSTGDNAALIWDESRDEFVFATTTATGASTGDLSFTPANLSVAKIGAGTEQAEAKVHSKMDTAASPTYSTLAGVIIEDDSRPTLQLVGSANNIALIQFGDNASASGGQLYYDHSTDKLRVDAGGNTDRITVDANGELQVAGDALIGDDLTLSSDGAIVNFGANSKVTLTHSTDTNPTETSEGLVLQTSSALDDHIAFPLVLTHLTSGNPDSSDGAGTPGLGVGLGFQVDSDAGSLQNAGAITISTLDATSGSESYGMSFALMKNGGESDQPITFMSLDTDAGGGNQTELSVKFDRNNYFRTVVAANGATTLQTIDESSGTAGNLTLDSCGDIEFNADGGDITFKDHTQTAMSIDMATTAGDAIFKDAGGTEIFRIDGSADSLLMASDKKIEFNDSSQFIHGSSATVLALGATDEIDLTATAIDINGAVDVSGALTVGGNTIIGPSGAAQSGTSLTVHGELEVASGGGTGALTVAGQIQGTSTAGQQLRLKYDSDGYADFTVDSSGFLTIASSGDGAPGQTSLTDNVIIGASNQTGTSCTILGEAAISGPQAALSITATEGANAVITLIADEGDDGAADTATITQADSGALTIDAGGDIVLNADTGFIKFMDDTALHGAINMNDISGSAMGAAFASIYPNGQTAIDDQSFMAIQCFSDKGESTIITQDPSSTISGTPGDYENATTANDATLSLKPDGSLWIAPAIAVDRFAYRGALIMDRTNDSAWLPKWHFDQGGGAGSDNAVMRHYAPNGSQYYERTVKANGETEIRTSSGGGTSGHLDFDIDGDIILDADGGAIDFKDGGVSKIEFTLDTTAPFIQPADGLDLAFGYNDSGTDVEIFKLDRNGGTGTNGSLLMATGQNIEFGAAARNIVDSGSDLVVTSGGALNLNAANGVEISTATPTAHGTGVSDAQMVDMAVGEINGERVTTIAVDITGLACTGDSNHTIGDPGSGGTGEANAYLTQITDAVNGIIYRVEMACIVPPAGTQVALDIDLKFNESALNSLTRSDLGANATIINTDGDWVKGTYQINNPGVATAMNLTNMYLYLVNGNNSHDGGTYTAGKFLIKLYGANF